MKRIFRLKINIIRFIILLFVIQACDTEDAPDCFQTVGKMTTKEVSVEAFHELIVYKGIKLFIEQGPEHKVVIESGENLIGEISAEVENGRLSDAYEPIKAASYPMDRYAASSGTARRSDRLAFRAQRRSRACAS